MGIECMCVCVVGTRSHGIGLRVGMIWAGEAEREVTCLLSMHGALGLFPSKRQWTCLWSG